MKKPIIIIGKSASGKTTLAKKIASLYNEDEVCFISYRRNDIVDDFFFSKCTINTRLIVIEEFYDLNQILDFIHIVSKNLDVQKKGEHSFKINPQYVFTYQKDPIDCLNIELIDSLSVFFKLVFLINGVCLSVLNKQLTIS